MLRVPAGFVTLKHADWIRRLPSQADAEPAMAHSAASSSTAMRHTLRGVTKSLFQHKRAG